MPTPEFITELRALVGRRPLWLSVAVAAVFDDRGRVLLGRRADNGEWGLPGGIIEPGEQPADAAVRECHEETGIVSVPETLTSVTVSPPITYPNGDQTQYVELTFRCRAVGGEPAPVDGENVAVGWFAVTDLPPMNAANRAMLDPALRGETAADFSFSGLETLLPGKD